MLQALKSCNKPQSNTPFESMDTTWDPYNTMPMPMEDHHPPLPPPPHHLLLQPISFDHPQFPPTLLEEDADDEEELGAMKEMMFKIAAMQPVDIDPATIRRPRRRNVRISEDPQSVAARHRRERISEKIRILQRLVPGGTKMDTASMLDEAIRYVKFLKRQVRILQAAGGAAAHGFGDVAGDDQYPTCFNRSSLI